MLDEIKSMNIKRLEIWEQNKAYHYGQACEYDNEIKLEILEKAIETMQELINCPKRAQLKELKELIEYVNRL